MTDSGSSFPGGGPTRGGGSLRSEQELIARAQRLVDTPRPPEGRPLSWYVEALHVGDLTTLAAMTLRSERRASAQQPRPRAVELVSRRTGHFTLDADSQLSFDELWVR